MVFPKEKMSKANTNSSNNKNRGRFLMGRPVPSLRRPQKKSGRPMKPNGGAQRSLQTTTTKSRAAQPSRGGGATLSIFNDAADDQQQQSKRVSFGATQQQQQRPHYSTSPIANSETIDATGFSKAELHDLEESFKLFDIYGEGNVQVGDLRGILEVLDQEQQVGDDTTRIRYPHLTTLLNRLSELSDEDTLSLEDYIQLMASTTIGNSIAIETNNANPSPNDHFERVFRLFDSGDKGYITLQDMERIAIELGEHDMTKGELQEMIDRAVGGTDGDGTNNNDGPKRVGLEEFSRMMTTSLFPSN